MSFSYRIFNTRLHLSWALLGAFFWAGQVGCSSDTKTQPVQDQGNAQLDAVIPIEDGATDVNVPPTDSAPPQEDLSLTDQESEDVGAPSDTQNSIEDLSGNWLQFQISHMVFEFAGSQPVEGTIYTYHLVTHTQDGLGWTARHEICSIFSESSQLPAKTIIPLAYVQSLAPYERAVEYVSDGEGAFFYNGADFTEIKGCVLSSIDEELPSEPDDERVIDQDDDGKPGLTLRLIGTLDGDLYIVQRDRTRPHGKTVDAERIEGLLDWDSTQQILDSDPAILKQFSPLALPHPDPNLSRFEMVRIPQSADCEWVNENRDQLLPIPEDD